MCAYTTARNYTWSQVAARDIYWREIILQTNSRVVIVKRPIFAKKKKGFPWTARCKSWRETA